MTEEVKRGRGRPRKDATVKVEQKTVEESVPTKEEEMQAIVREALTSEVSPPKVVESYVAPSQPTVSTVPTSTRPNSITVQELFQMMRNR